MSETTHRRVMNLIARGRLVETDDTNGLQYLNLRLLAGEAKTRVERFQQYGFSSIPRPGSEVVALFPGGSRDHCIVMSVDDRGARIRGGAPGEVSLYSDEGDHFTLTRGNKIVVATHTLEITADTEVHITAGNVVIEGPIVTSGGDVSMTGNLAVNGNVAVNGNLSVTGTYPKSAPGRYELRGVETGGVDPETIGWANRADSAALLQGALLDSGRWRGVVVIDQGDAP
jgi:phage baseplate assembly protein V